MKKILLVHKFFYIIGGAEVFFFETSRILKEKGHQIAFFSTINEHNQPTIFSKYFVEAPDFRNANILTRIGSIIKIIYSFEAKQKFKSLIQDFKPDIVHMFAIFTHISPSILDVCREAGIPVVLSCNDYKQICPNNLLFYQKRLCEDCKGGRFYNAVLNRCCKNSLMFSVASSLEAYIHNALDMLRKNVHTFLFASEFMARKYEEFWGADTFRWRKLTNPFNSLLSPLSSEYEDYFLFYGRFVEEKGVEILLRAMQKIPKAKLILVGDGPEDKYLRTLSDKLRLENVKFVGPMWGQDMDCLLKKARFVVVPSIWYENFPYVVLQAFAVGKAVIGTDRGGIPELIKDKEFGYIYPANAPDTLAMCIEKLWNNPDIAVEMGKKAKSYVDLNYNDSQFYNNLMGIYEEILK